jgi:hypothetical protein
MLATTPRRIDKLTVVSYILILIIGHRENDNEFFLFSILILCITHWLVVSQWIDFSKNMIYMELELI